MAGIAKSPFVAPFRIEIDWEVVISDIRTRDAAVGQKRRLAVKHPDSHVRVLDRHGEEVAAAPKKRPRRE